jgi:predicted outer membrane repeat protein
MSMKTVAFRFLSIFVLLTLLSTALGVSPAHAAGILYVTPDEAGDCASWKGACPLQTALAKAVGGEEIWVASGTYKPTTGTDRAATFQLKEGVAVYGGFNGTETTLDERDPAVNVTILSGDLNGDDVDFLHNTENVYHVVTGANDAILSGFTVTGGNANGDVFPEDSGGGMLNFNSSPSLKTVIFSGNSTKMGGGGMFNYKSNLSMTEVTFLGNQAAAGGGIYEYQSAATFLGVTFDGNTATLGGGMVSTSDNPTLTDITFVHNSADMGGGLYEELSAPTLTNVTFVDNSATSNGGGMLVSFTSSPTLTNITFSGNSADTNGGGMAIAMDSTPTLTNVTFTENHAGTNGGGIYNTASYPSIRNAIFWENTDLSGLQVYDDHGIATISDSVVQGPCSIYSICTNIISADPVLGTLGNYGGFTQTIPLLADSSAIDTGDDDTCPATDPRGVHRPRGTHCDIGAYEYEYTRILHVMPAASGTGDCQDWENACGLQTALAKAYRGDEIWTAAGIYTPTDGSDRKMTFQLGEGVPVYGGFNGTETAREQRDPAANLTILSGDLNGDDNEHVKFDEPTRADNSYHVVMGADGALLDGFTITGGNSNEESEFNGGGVVNLNSSPTFANVILRSNSALQGGGMYNALDSNPILTGVTFSGNAADYGGGGGMFNYASNPTLTDVTFERNTAYYNDGNGGLYQGHGGGIMNFLSSPTLTDVRFNGNAADYGGGMINDYFSSPVLNNVTFNNNLAAYNGGGMYNATSEPTLTNVTFSGNSAHWACGGGMHNTQSKPTLTKVIFKGNSANCGGGMYNTSSDPILVDILFDGNTAKNGGGMHNASGAPSLLNVTFLGNSAIQGGGIYDQYDDHSRLQNVTFSGNSAWYGAGMLTSYASPTLINVTFSGNLASVSGGGMYNDSGSHPQAGNTIFWGNAAPGGSQIANVNGASAALSNSVVQGGYADGTNIISTDPLLGAPGYFGGFSPTIPFDAHSSALDMGNDDICPAADQRGVDRPQGAHCDIGAYEFRAGLFIDVPPSYWASDFIERLYQAGVSGGCSSSAMMYCPNANVNRAQMAVFLLRAKYGDAYLPPAAGGSMFGDVPAEYWAAAWIEQLAAEGITGGCGNDNYCPETIVTRDQMAILLLRGKYGDGYLPPTAGGVLFGDVPADHWAAAWIEQLANEGVTGGCGDGNYCPSMAVTRGQMAVFLVKAFDLP